VLPLDDRVVDRHRPVVDESSERDVMVDEVLDRLAQRRARRLVENVRLAPLQQRVEDRSAVFLSKLRALLVIIRNFPHVLDRTGCPAQLADDLRRQVESADTFLQPADASMLLSEMVQAGVLKPVRLDLAGAGASRRAFLGLVYGRPRDGWLDTWDVMKSGAEPEASLWTFEAVSRD
jgi:hypothetical protein